MKAKIIVYAFLAVILTTIHFAEAQQATKVRRIGWLSTGFLSTMSARQQAFRQGLRELGYWRGRIF